MLKVMHPELYAAAREALVALRPVTATPAILEKWASVFSAVQVIANRETPYHRDNKSRSPWFDILVSLGEYSDSVLEFPAIGLRINYLPGTVVAFCGKVLRHGVPQSKGERICFAYFMRDSVHHAMRVKAPHWMECHCYAVWDGWQDESMGRIWRPL